MGNGRKAGHTASLLFLCIVSTILLAESLDLPCDWSGGSGKLEGYIPGTPSNLSVTNGDGECRDQCMSQTGFICAAVNYQVSHGLCELVAENSQTASVGEPFDGSWLYFIRPLCAGMWLPWTAEKGTFIAGNSFSESTTDNLQDCMTSCMRDPSDGDECRAINIKTSLAHSNNNNCRLRSEKPGEGVRNNTSWQYFNRPIWYSESSSDATQAEIKDQGTIGNYMHLFTDKPLPVSGYLVAWQYYYIPIMNDNPCSQYAAIWRENGGSSYNFVAKTLLSTEESQSGVRFQFVQNEAIRVQQGDVLSIFKDGCGNQHLVSTAAQSGQNQTFTIQSFFAITDGTTISTTTAIAQRRSSPALRAFVSAYLSLDGSPQTYYNITLSSGQIWLKLPPPLTTEESVVVAGYMVTCSTDVNLSPLVPCYNNLVPVNSRDVLLNLPDVTKTYHVSVQIARNFNGVELLDDKYSPVSSAFCTGRERTGKVNISESTVTDMETKPEVNVTFLHVFQADDMCAKEIKLNYSGYDSAYRIIDNTLQTKHNLQLEQDTTYELTIYLKLADATEIVFWTQEYTTSSLPTTTANGDGSNGPSVGGNASTIAAAVIVPLVILAAIVIVLFVLYRRGVFKRLERRPITVAFNEATATRMDDVRKGSDVDIPDEYDEVSSPPVPNPNDYEEADLPAGNNPNEYEMVGSSTTHDYEKLDVNRQSPKKVLTFNN